MCDMLHLAKSRQKRMDAHTCACFYTVTKAELVFTHKVAL